MIDNKRKNQLHDHITAHIRFRGVFFLLQTFGDSHPQKCTLWRFTFQASSENISCFRHMSFCCFCVPSLLYKLNHFNYIVWLNGFHKLNIIGIRMYLLPWNFANYHRKLTSSLFALGRLKYFLCEKLTFPIIYFSTERQ